jgi:hypothetical protein
MVVITISVTPAKTIPSPWIPGIGAPPGIIIIGIIGIVGSGGVVVNRPEMELFD